MKSEQIGLDEEVGEALGKLPTFFVMFFHLKTPKP